VDVVGVEVMPLPSSDGDLEAWMVAVTMSSTLVEMGVREER
jgi:hypothetical protein